MESRFDTIKLGFSASSTGKMILSQDIDVEDANLAVVNVGGVRSYSYELNLVNWIVTDVIIDTASQPATVTITSIDRNNTTKDSLINVDISGDPTAIVTVTLFGVTTAVEYDAPPLWVKGPDNEQDQYENPGQWYYDEDNSTIEIYIP